MEVYSSSPSHATTYCMALKLTLKTKNIPIDEAAKWRATSFNTEITQDEIDRLVSVHGADVLLAHYDNGVPTGKEGHYDTSYANYIPDVPARGKETLTPQSTFNPRGEWNTPVGIYYYPLSWAADKIMGGPSKIPFVADTKYVYIYKLRDPSKRLDVSDIPHNGFIEMVIYDLIKSGRNFISILNMSGLSKEAIEDVSQVYFGNSVDLTKDIVSDLAIVKPPPNTIFEILNKHGMDEQNIVLSCYYILNNSNDRKPARLTKYLLSKGVDVIEDSKGVGAIHVNERFQGAILRVAAVQLIGVYLNRFRKDRGKPVHIDPKEMNPAKLRGLLSLPDGKKLINRALEFAKKDPKETSMFLQVIFNNSNITKDKALADKIADNVNPNSVNNLATAGFIKNFASNLTPDELEKALSKIASENSLSIAAHGADASRIITAFNEAFDEIKIKYGDKFDFDKYPTLKSLKDSRDAAAEQSYAEDVVNNLRLYSLEDLKIAFPITLKQKNPEGQSIEFAIAVSNVVESIDFKNKPIEERMEFSEWLFDTYPQAWSDDAAIRSCLSAMRYVRAEDNVTPEAEEEYIQKRSAGFYHKLLVHWEDMKADPKLLDKLAKERAAINKKYGVTTENRFKKLNRIGSRWSRFS